MKDESKKVYILLSKTKTVPSNLIKLMTREPYCHTSLALDISLDEMYRQFCKERCIQSI